MLDEQAKAIQEVAKVTGKAFDVVTAVGGFLDDVFGRTLRELGTIPVEWAKYARWRTTLAIAEKSMQQLKARGFTESVRQTEIWWRVCGDGAALRRAQQFENSIHQMRCKFFPEDNSDVQVARERGWLANSPGQLGVAFCTDSRFSVDRCLAKAK